MSVAVSVVTIKAFSGGLILVFANLSRFAVMVLVALCLSGDVATVRAQEQTQSRSPAAASPDVDAIIRAFMAKETEFAKALNNYGFKRDAVVQTIGMGGQVTGEYRRTSQFSFDDRGGRYERISYFPQSTLTEVSFTQEDLEDLGGVQPFALEASKLDRYKVTYVGKERIDELDLYVFDVAPKVMPKKVSDRLFLGRVWVDDRDLQIVKVRGKGVPEGKQRFPIFETYREQVDGKYWFPTYTSVDDELVFPDGQTVHLRMTVRYMDYRRFKGSVRVIEEGEPGLAPQ
jgi:nitrogen regulatory protein PII